MTARGRIAEAAKLPGLDEATRHLFEDYAANYRKRDSNLRWQVTEYAHDLIETRNARAELVARGLLPAEPAPLPLPGDHPECPAGRPYAALWQQLYSETLERRREYPDISLNATWSQLNWVLERMNEMDRENQTPEQRDLWRQYVEKHGLPVPPTAEELAAAKPDCMGCIAECVVGTPHTCGSAS